MDEREREEVETNMRVSHLEDAMTNIKDAVSELRDVVTMLSKIQVEQQHTNKKVEHILEKLEDLYPKANKGEQAYQWMIRAAAAVLGTIGLTVLGIVLFGDSVALIK